ncbi:MAG: WG repeat-containing protein [Ignavibacteriae bacterium]|nr:WG repeat-containing protein [Ignavibacteriota bacterium]
MFKLSLVFFCLLFFSDLYSQNLYPVIIDDEMGYIDSTGKIIIEPKFATDINEFSVQLGNKNFKGFIFNRGCYFKEGLAIARKPIKFLFIVFGYHYGYINQSGEFEFETDNGELEPFSSGMAPMIIHERYIGSGYDYKYGYINKKNEIAIAPRFDYAGPFNDGVALVIKNNNFSYIDTAGRPVLETKYEDAFGKISALLTTAGITPLPRNSKKQKISPREWLLPALEASTVT